MKPIQTALIEKEEWFPLQSDRNKNELKKPELIFRVEDGDRTPLDYFAKHFCQENDTVESEVLDWLEIKKVQSSGKDKILKQLKHMKDKEPTINWMRSRYKDLTKRLGETGDIDCINAPLLVRDSQGKVCWWEGDRKDCHYTAERKFRIYEQYYPEYKFVLFDEDMSQTNAQKFGVSIFHIKTYIKTVSQQPDEDPELRTYLRDALPDCLAIALSPSIPLGGSSNEADDILKSWNIVKLYKDKNVTLVLNCNGDKTEPIGKENFDDVQFSVDVDKQYIVHDLSHENLRKNLWKFGLPFAAVVFKNRNLAPYFESRLRYLSREEAEPWLKHINILEQDRNEAEQLIAKYEVDDNKLNEIKELISNKCFGGGALPDEDVWRNHWMDGSWYAEKKVNCSIDDIVNLKPEVLEKFCTSLDPTNYFCKKIREFLNDKGRIRDLAIAWLMDHSGAFEDAKGIEQFLLKCDVITLTTPDMKNYSFDWEKFIPDMLEKKYEFINCTSVDEYLERKKKNIQGWDSATDEIDTEFCIDKNIKFDLKPQEGPISFSNDKGFCKTKTEEQRSLDNIHKAKQGESAEIRYARAQARNILGLNEDERKAAWELICGEWVRIEKNVANKIGPPIDNSNMPSDRKELGDNFLRVAKYYDGLGYDVMTVEKGNLVRVEVKSSARQESHQIFLSENERSCSEKYLEEEKENKSKTQWRLVLFFKKGKDFAEADITVKIKDSIQYKHDPGILKPVEWLIHLE
ncbi:MAG: hypothetical protein WC799_15255 [Desulfobacteraceae bacterium]